MIALDICTENPGLAKWINVCGYSVPGLALVFAGTVLWLVAYLLIVRNALRNKYVEMPVMAASANIAWEFVWGFLFTTDLGDVFVWGLRGWFFFDVFIFYNVLRFGQKQVNNPILTRVFQPSVILMTLAWGALFFFYIREGHDTSMGATSAFLINVLMSAVYITSMTASRHPEGYSTWVAWLKMLGTALMTVFLFLHYPASGYMISMGVLCFVLDMAYIYLLSRRKAAHS